MRSGRDRRDRAAVHVRAGPALDTAESLAQALSSKARLRARLSDKVAAMERRRPGPAWRTGRWDAEK